MEIVEIGIKLRTGGNGWAPEGADLAPGVGAAGDILHRLALDVHAADKDRIRPVEFAILRRADILIDEANLPPFRQIGGDQQDALRRHEGAHPHQFVSMLEGAERGGIARKNAQDAARMVNDDLASHGRPSPWAVDLSSNTDPRPRFPLAQEEVDSLGRAQTLG